MPRSREAQAEYRRARYAAYHRLCESLGIEPRGRRWLDHLAELNDDSGRRLTKAELVAYWQERGWTRDDALGVAGSFELTRREEEGIGREEVLA